MGSAPYTAPVALSWGAGLLRSTSEPVDEWWPPSEQATEHVDRLDVTPGSTTASWSIEMREPAAAESRTPTERGSGLGEMPS
jgi:hypothetical protein